MRFSTQQVVDDVRRRYRRAVSVPLREPSFTYKRVELTRLLARMELLGVGDPVFAVNAKDDAYDWARALGVRVPERLGVYGGVTEVPWDALPDRLVLKPCNGTDSRGVYLLSRRGDHWLELRSGRRLTSDEVMREYADLVAAASVSVDLLAEELVTDPRFPDLPPVDYKVYCFYGTVGIIKVKGHHAVRGTEQKAWRQFDARWRDIGNPFHHYVMDRSIPPPVHADELLAMASLISAAIPRPFVRVDLYDGEDGPVFGEITPMPGDKTIVSPRIDRMLGEMWDDAEVRLQAELVRAGLLTPRTSAPRGTAATSPLRALSVVASPPATPAPPPAMASAGAAGLAAALPTEADAFGGQQRPSASSGESASAV